MPLKVSTKLTISVATGLPSASERDASAREANRAVEHGQRDQRRQCNRGQREIEQAHQYRDRHDVERAR